MYLSMKYVFTGCYIGIVNWQKAVNMYAHVGHQRRLSQIHSGTIRVTGINFYDIDLQLKITFQ